MLQRFAHIARESGAKLIAAAFYDYETETSWSGRGDRWFHAASTIKVAVLLAVFAEIERGRLELQSRVHVRNRFHSVVDGEPYRISSSRDANSEVHAALGRTMTIEDLARHMIVTSSNLATNLLVELVGVERIRQVLADLGATGIDFRRGVEDDRAYRAGVNNLVTAEGLVWLFRLIHERRAISAHASEHMLDILSGQQFKSGIPAGIPSTLRSQSRFAHKTGEISTAAHDAGLVFLPERQPFAVAVLTEWEPDGKGRQQTVAKVSRAIYSYLTHGTHAVKEGVDG